jgi:hypothetical protein
MTEEQRELLIEPVVAGTANARRSPTRAKGSETLGALAEHGGNSSDLPCGACNGVDLLETHTNMAGRC